MSHGCPALSESLNNIKIFYLKKVSVFVCLRWCFAILSRLILNLWAQVILLLQPPEWLGL
jgi:hypothetical protein